MIPVPLASSSVTFPVYPAANVPSNAAFTSAVDPDKATVTLLRVIVPSIALLIVFNCASVCALLNVAVGVPLNASTSPTAVVISAAVPVMFILFDTVTVPEVAFAIVEISVAAIPVPLASLIVTFPVYPAANVPASAALISAAEPTNATVASLRVIVPDVPLLIVFNWASV